MSISHDCLRSRSNTLLFERCFSNNNKTNRKINKYLWLYHLWYSLLSDVLLLHVSRVFGPLVWKTVQKPSCFWIAFWTTGKHQPMQQESNKRRQANHIIYYIFWRNACCCLMTIHCCVFHFETVVLNYSYLLLRWQASSKVLFWGAQKSMTPTVINLDICTYIYIGIYYLLFYLLNLKFKKVLHIHT